MKKSRLLGAVRACFTIILFGAAGNALAALITVNSDVTNGLYQDTTLTGLFDLTPYLSTPDYNSPYVINSATVSFSISDNSDALIYDYYGSFTYHYSDPTESLDLNLSGEQVSGSTNYYSNTVQTGSTIYSSYSCGAFGTQTCYNYGPQYTNTSGFNGTNVITLALTGTGLAALESNGLLNFTGQVSGSLNLNSSTLTVDVSANPVPIPSAIWLFGSGLLGLVGIARRKKTA